MMGCDSDTVSFSHTGTIRPAPPPKPSHLSSAFTGTLDSDALRSYIRQQSIINTTHKQQHRDSTCSSSMGTIRAALEGGGMSEDEDEGVDVQWGTARQTQLPPLAHQHETPTKPAYGSLAQLFSPEQAQPISGSQITVRPGDASRRAPPAREASSDSQSENASTIKMTRAEVARLQGSPSAARRSSGSTSSLVSTLRSRQPSILSRLSAFSDDEDDEGVAEGLRQETPKKRWMHVRDGSAFEHAGPKPFHCSSPTKKMTLSTSAGELKTLVAGPPPIRPLSIAVELGSEGGMDEHHDQAAKTCLPSTGGGRQARALYAFTGQTSFNELCLAPGQVFEILNEDVSGGWSLAIARQGSEERGWKRGLVPRGWYTYIQDFTKSPGISAEAEGSANSPVGPPSFILDHQGSRANHERVEATFSSSWLSPTAASSHPMSHSSSNGSVLSPEGAREQQRKWDRSRPASGVGELYSGTTESGTAMQALTQMNRSTSNSSFLQKPLWGLPIKECRNEEGNMSKGSFESDGVLVSTTATSPSEEEYNEASKALTSPSGFISAWKSPSLFGGRTLNRFVPFVTSGAEEYVLFGKTLDELAAPSAAPRYDVISGNHGGPSWKHPGLDVFVEIHSPEVQVDESGKHFTAFVVHSSYLLSPEDQLEERPALDPHHRPDEVALRTSSVYRRFNQFRWLHHHLSKSFPALTLSMPPFPSANHGTGKNARFEPLFVERRRRQLQTWLLQVVRHAVLCNDAAVRFFLDNEEEGEDWTTAARAVQQEVAAGTVDPSARLYASTFHPVFNVDIAESALEAKQMAMFNEAYQRGMVATDTGMLNSLRLMRQSTSTTSDSYRQLSYSLLRLITGSQQGVTKSNGGGPAALHLDSLVALPPMGNVGRRDESGATNEQRAWCWREGCVECKRMTRSLQGTAEALQVVADCYEGHSNGGLLELHSRMAAMAKMNSQHASLLEIHKASIAKYREATGEPDPLLETDEQGAAAAAREAESGRGRTKAEVDATMEQVASRCETVINVTMSEMDRVHKERVQDWNNQASQLFDSQIAFYQDILSTLQIAKSQMDKESDNQVVESSEGPILPSPYESQLANPLRALPLLQPESLPSSGSYFALWK